MNLRRTLCTLVLAAVLTGCGAAGQETTSAPSGADPNMTIGYIKSVRELGAVGMTDGQILAAGQFVCSKYGNMAKPEVPYSQRFAAYGDLLDQGFVPARPGDKVLGALLDSTPFLCLEG